jgi:hypothetical protein
MKGSRDIERKEGMKGYRRGGEYGCEEEDEAINNFTGLKIWESSQYYIKFISSSHCQVRLISSLNTCLILMNEYTEFGNLSYMLFIQN